MKSSPIRGAVLVGIAALLAFFVLRGVADNGQIPVETAGESTDETATPTVDPLVEATPAVTPTAEIDPSTARNNSEVSVLVANGTTVTGLAGRLTSSLRNQGFMTRDPKTADPQTTSTIYYRTGFAAEATVVRSVLGGTTPIAPMPEPDPVLGADIDLAPVDVLVLVGADDLSAS